MKLLHVVGARPNFMKLAPVYSALHRHSSVEQVVVHTGQHYDAEMSAVFFRDLGIPEPDLNLKVGSGSHAQQTAAIMSRFEPVVQDHKPDWVLVYGDVNSTMAATLVCAKLLVPVAHVEAGLRSGDRTMPEEINRVVTDQLAELLFTPSADAEANLVKEGIAPARIRLVGNVMIDSLVRIDRQTASRPDGLPPRYLLVTLHRPSNVDHDERLRGLMAALHEVSEWIPVIFPVHPRTKARLSRMELDRLDGAHLRLCEPLPYIEFVRLERHATVVVTDSGGVQEETTFYQVPCLTLREHTERPVTVTMGTNQVIGADPARLVAAVGELLNGHRPVGRIPPLWDGRAGERIATVLTQTE